MRTGKFFTLFMTGVIVLAGNSFAQKTVTEAILTYSISIESSSEKVAMSKTLDGATLSVYLKGAQSKTDMTSALGTESNQYDAKAGKGIILKQYSGQKLMITLSSANWAQKNQVNQNMKFSIENGEQTIAGFRCKKAIGQAADGKTFTVYFSPDIILANKQYDNAFAGLPGVPVQYELQSGKLKFKYSLTGINYDPVPLSKFEIPKTGFRIMTYEENQQLRKGDK